MVKHLGPTWVTKQPYLGEALLAPQVDASIKGDIEKRPSNFQPDRLAKGGWSPKYQWLSKKKKQKL